MSESAAERIKELQALGWREAEILRQLEREYYDVSRRFVRNVMGTSTELRDDRVVESEHAPPDDLHAFASSVGMASKAMAGFADAHRSAFTVHTSYITKCPPPIDITGGKPASIQLDRWVGIADVHTPIHDARTLERACRVAQKERIRDLVLPGDFFDNAEYSRHGDDIQQVDVNDALARSGQVLQWLAETFDTIHMLPGNHCRRVAKRLNKNLSFRNLVLMAIGEYSIADRIKTYEDDYILIGDDDTGQDPQHVGWIVGHPAFFNKVATQGYDVLALLKRRHIFGAHRHTLGIARYHNRYMLVDPGTACQPWLAPYIRRGWGMAKHADQSNGFAVVRGGNVRIFADGFIDWADYGC